MLFVALNISKSTTIPLTQRSSFQITYILVFCFRVRFVTSLTSNVYFELSVLLLMLACWSNVGVLFGELAFRGGEVQIYRFRFQINSVKGVDFPTIIGSKEWYFSWACMPWTNFLNADRKIMLFIEISLIHHH